MARRTKPPATDEDRLLAEIRSNPHDDAPRLVYADRLLELGGERAWHGELIHVECRLAELGPRDEQRPALEQRRARLLSGKRPPGFPTFDDLKGGSPRFAIDTSRGFPSHLRGRQLSIFVDEAKTLFHRIPLLDGIEINVHRPGDAAATERLAALPQLARFRRLGLIGSLTDGIGTRGLRALLRSPHIPVALHALALPRTRIGDAGLVQLVTSPMLRSVRYLDLTGNMFGAMALVALARSPNVAALTTLLLTDNSIGIKVARELAASPHLAGLSELVVGQYHSEVEISIEAGDVLRARFGAALVNGGELARTKEERVEPYSGLTRR